MAFDSNESAATAEAEISLDALPVGGRGVVVEVGAGGPIGGRLRDLGFVPGTPVTLERRAPMGDPAVYVLRGTRLCLRRSEAREIRIRPLG
ncbi:MAG: FeoA family protein [Myxococcota bacterium]|nr:FeoA family protein [Myxococcota bacterium]